MPPRMIADDDFDAAREIETAWAFDGKLVVSVKAARDAGEKCADDEGDVFVVRGIEADGFAGDFVVMRGA